MCELAEGQRRHHHEAGFGLGHDQHDIEGVSSHYMNVPGDR